MTGIISLVSDAESDGGNAGKVTTVTLPEGAPRSQIYHEFRRFMITETGPLPVREHWLLGLLEQEALRNEEGTKP